LCRLPERPNKRKASGFLNLALTLLAFLFQVIILVLIVSFFYNAVGNLLNNIESRGIHTGFDFLGVESGFDIAEHLIDYSSTSSNLRVFCVGLINTIVVSVVGIIFASIIGLVIGIARLSNTA
jgi:general L-amino acid transport system permease protein